MTDWPHAPPHRTSLKGTYMITAGTYQKNPLFNTPDKLTLLQNSLLTLSKKYHWNLKAWAIFANHYHFIADSTTPENLKALISELHLRTAQHINAIDHQLGRQVWFQYWDSFISYQRSYLARLNYVMKNPVKHRLTDLATNYP